MMLNPILLNQCRVYSDVSMYQGWKAIEHERSGLSQYVPRMERAIEHERLGLSQYVPRIERAIEHERLGLSQYVLNRI